MKKKAKILYCGPCASEMAVVNKVAVRPSEVRWSQELLCALSKVVNIDVISHCREQRWPAGKVFWQDDDPKWFNDFLPCKRIAYPNIVGLKDAYLSMAYRRAVKQLLRTNRYDAFICYNTLHPYHIAAMSEAHKVGVKCIPIILDGDDPRNDNWRKLLRDNRFADGVVFLSWWMYKNYPVQNIPLLHMDGGADEFKGVPPPMAMDCSQTTKHYTLVHTGALDYWRGLNFMKDVVGRCKRQDVRFVFCGKCDKRKMWEEFGNDPRVDVRGFVSDSEIDEICRSADVFLNVRDPQIGDNILNYPSKVPQYLAWGKPVVSTWIDSFSPDFRNVLDVCDNTPEGFVQVLNAVLDQGMNEKLMKYNVIREWFTRNKSWNVQAGRLVDFIRGLPTIN